MNNRIAYTNPDGTVSIVIPSNEFAINKLAQIDDDSLNVNSQVVVDAVLTDLMDRLPETAINPRLITIDNLPSDRLFRDAWTDENPTDTIDVDINKAKELAHNMRREDRQIKLTPLDEEGRFTSTSQSRKDEIVTEKQMILDSNSSLQKDIDDASDETDLRIALTANSII